MVKQIQQFKPHFQCLGLFPLWIFEKRAFNGWISDAKIGLFYKLTNLWEDSLLLLLLCCYFSILLKQYGDHDMVQSILSWLASEAIKQSALLLDNQYEKKSDKWPILCYIKLFQTSKKWEMATWILSGETALFVGKINKF